MIDLILACFEFGEREDVDYREIYLCYKAQVG